MSPDVHDTWTPNPHNRLEEAQQVEISRLRAALAAAEERERVLQADAADAAKYTEAVDEMLTAYVKEQADNQARIAAAEEREKRLREAVIKIWDDQRVPPWISDIARAALEGAT